MQKLNERKKNRSLRYLQIHRSKLDYFLKMKSLGITVDYQEVNDCAQKAKNSAKVLKDYHRHSAEIDHLIICLIS